MTSTTVRRSAILPRAELRHALAVAAKVAPRRTTTPILGQVLVRQDGDAVAVVATDLDREITTILPGAVCDAGFATMLPALMFRDVERQAIASEDVEIHKSQSESAVLSFAGLACTMETRAVADFPSTTIEGPIHADFEMPTADLLGALRATHFAVSTEETRYYLNGVYLHAFRDAGRDRLRAVATDGHRMAIHDLPAVDNADLSSMPGIIVPRETVALLIDLCKAKGAPATVRVKVNTIKAVFMVGNVSLLTKLIQGTFPDYARAIPAGNEKAVTLAPAALASAIRAVSSMASDRGRAVKLTIHSGDDGTGRITASVENADSGTASMSLPCDSKYPIGLTVGFNARYLLDILALMGGEDEVLAEFGDAGSPALFSAGPGAATRFVLMPMRV